MGKQLGYNERKFIEKQVKRKVRKSEIARVLGVSHTTVGREVNNQKNWEWERVGKKVIKRYSAKKAQSNYENNKMRCGAKYKFIQDSKWLEYIEKCVKLGESPGSAIGRIETEGLQFGVDITERTFYNYVERGISNITPFDLRFKLRRRAPKHKKIRENKRKLGKSIEERPENINSRAEFGHWEGDSVVDKNDNAILVLVERKSRKCVLYKLPKHDSNTVLEKMKIFLKEYKPKSLTMDNGSEFHRVPQLENEDFICYFTHPYSSFEKGSVENLNGIIRRYIPKGSDISKLTEEDVKRVEMQVNDMPRKIHGYYTSEEMYQSLTKNEPPTILKKHLDNVIFLTQKMCI